MPYAPVHLCRRTHAHSREVPRPPGFKLLLPDCLVVYVPLSQILAAGESTEAFEQAEQPKLLPAVVRSRNSPGDPPPPPPPPIRAHVQ